MPRTIFPFDEVNAFRQNLRDFHLDPRTGRIKSREDCEDIIDEMLDLFLLAYERGNEVINRQFGGNYEPPIEDVEKTIMLPIEGKAWVDRVWDWFDEGGDEADIMRIVETEAHRDGNTAAFVTAKNVGAASKTWHCTMLPTSRDTHIYLDGVTVPIDGEFYSYNGGSTQFPGEWGIPEEDVNCLCWLTFKA